MNACQTPKIAGIGALLDATQPIRNDILPLERFSRLASSALLAGGASAPRKAFIKFTQN
jgi:hypothetical protein